MKVPNFAILLLAIVIIFLLPSLSQQLSLAEIVTWAGDQPVVLTDEKGTIYDIYLTNTYYTSCGSGGIIVEVYKRGANRGMSSPLRYECVSGSDASRAGEIRIGQILVNSLLPPKYTMQIASNPSGNLYVNGTLIGQVTPDTWTPVTRETGSYLIEVSKPFYQRYKQIVTLTSDTEIMINLTKSAEPTPPPLMCAQVITYARNTTTGEYKEFPDSCIPEGWVKVDSIPIITPTPTPIPAPEQSAVTRIYLSIKAFFASLIELFRW